LGLTSLVVGHSKPFKGFILLFLHSYFLDEQLFVITLSFLDLLSPFPSLIDLFYHSCLFHFEHGDPIFELGIIILYPDPVLGGVEQGSSLNVQRVGQN
jgi:hypothetical protein